MQDIPSGGVDASALDEVAVGVQANCDLADALHAREKSLCTYLLGMREYFRWAEGLPLGVNPDRARLSTWIAQREHDWDALRERSDAAYGQLPLAAGIDPFDEDAVNRELSPKGLVYGGGLGLFGAPMFFLARRESEEIREGIRVIVAGTEVARGVTAAPAASRGGTILIRTDALRRWLWTRAESAQRGQRDTAFARALHAYGTDAIEAVEGMARGEAETLVLHELGELRAAKVVGTEWEDMVLGVSDRRTEVILRAVRDLLADCLVTLPVLVDRASTRSLDFWLANFDGMRRELAPQLVEPFPADSAQPDLAALERAAASGQRLWCESALNCLAAWRRGGAEAVRRETDRLLTSH
jgi:hypothetical protein